MGKDIQIDMIREIFSIGAGNSATALSNLINKTVMISVPRLRVLESHKMPEALGSIDQEFILVNTRFRDSKSCLIFIISKNEGKRIISSWMGSDIPQDEAAFVELVLPGLVESGNILAGAFVSSLGNLMEIKTIPCPPEAAVDYLAGILDNISAALDNSVTKILLFDVNMRIDDNDLLAHLALIPCSNFLNSIEGAATKILH